MQDPNETHLCSTKRTLRHTNGTCSFGILNTSECSGLVGYMDSNWARSIYDHKHTSTMLSVLDQAVDS
jgi:hypothetical protein